MFVNGDFTRTDPKTVHSPLTTISIPLLDPLRSRLVQTQPGYSKSDPVRPFFYVLWAYLFTLKKLEII